MKSYNTKIIRLGSTIHYPFELKLVEDKEFEEFLKSLNGKYRVLRHRPLPRCHMYLDKLNNVIAQSIWSNRYYRYIKETPTVQ